MTRAIVRRKHEGIEEELIFRTISLGSYMPYGESISVYDREKDNVVINEGQYDTGESCCRGILTVLPEVRRYTVSRDVLNRIIELIRESGVLNIRSFENREKSFMDGSSENFYFCADGKKKLIDCDSFYEVYDGCNESTNAGKLMKLVDDIEELL